MRGTSFGALSVKLRQPCVGNARLGCCDDRGFENPARPKRANVVEDRRGASFVDGSKQRALLGDLVGIDAGAQEADQNEGARMEINGAAPAS